MQHEAHSGTNWMRILCVCKCMWYMQCVSVSTIVCLTRRLLHICPGSPRGPWVTWSHSRNPNPNLKSHYHYPLRFMSLSAPHTHTHADRDSIIWGSHNAQSVKSVGPNTRQGHVRENLKTHTDRQRDGHDVCLSVWQGGGDQRSLAGLHFVAYQVVKCCTWLIPYTAWADCAHFLDLSLVDAGHRHPLLSGVISPKNVRNHCAYDKLFLP